MKQKLIIYISGAITNNPNYIQDFTEAENFLKEKYKDTKIINPIKYEKKGQSRVYYMRKDIKKLMECNAIYLINGWEKCEVARLEKYIADKLNFWYYDHINNEFLMNIPF